MCGAKVCGAEKASGYGSKGNGDSSSPPGSERDPAVVFPAFVTLKIAVGRCDTSAEALTEGPGGSPRQSWRVQLEQDLHNQLRFLLSFSLFFFTAENLVTREQQLTEIAAAEKNLAGLAQRWASSPLFCLCAATAAEEEEEEEMKILEKCFR